MKTNKYANLIRFGFTQRTLMSLNETDINNLHKNLIEGKKDVCPKCGMTDCKCNHKKSETKEQVTQTTKQVKTTKIPSSTAKATGAVVDGVSIKQDASGNIIATQNEGEVSEGKTKKSKKGSKLNPWAICTSQLGNEFGTTERHLWNAKQNNKYERCVKTIKQSMNENTEVVPMSLIIENKILSLVEKHIQPKMKKGDLMNIITKKSMKTPITTLGSIDVSEDTKEAPVKTPVKTPSKPDKDSPYKPKTVPAPKAKHETKEQVVANAPTKQPTTKPGIKTPPKPDKDSPYKPKTVPAPKAKKSMPSWMSFDSIGIKLKK